MSTKRSWSRSAAPRWLGAVVGLALTQCAPARSLEADRPPVGVREGPARALREAQGVDALVRQLDSSSATDRAMAACRLGRMDADAVGRARERLLELLADGTEVEGPLCRDRRNRWNQGREGPSSPGREAAIALEELGADVVEPLVEVLQGEDPTGRENAAFALGLVESSRAVDPLLVALSGDPAARVRARAAWALGMIEDRGAAAALISALEDDDPDVREQAMWAVSMLVGSEGFGDIDRGDLADALRRTLEREPQEYEGEP